MKRTGATLAVLALEELGIEHTFGIPGVHNTELYDALGASDQIDPLRSICFRIFRLYWTAISLSIRRDLGSH